MNCKHCNAPLNDEAEFCAVCGTPTLRGELDKEAVVPISEDELPSAFDEMIDQAYDAAESGKDFNGSVPLTQVYKEEPAKDEPKAESEPKAVSESAEEPKAVEESSASVPPKKPKKSLKRVLIALLLIMVLAAGAVALQYFKIVHIPFLDGIFTAETTPDEPIDAPEAVADTSNVTLTALRANPADIPVGTDTEVVFTVYVSNPDGADVSHLKVYGDGMELCALNDAGEHGDALAGDGIYSGTCTFTSATPSVMSCTATLGEKESVPFTVSCYRTLTADDSARFKAFSEKLFGFTAYADAKAFIEQSDEVESFVATDSLNTVSCKTKYGVTCIWQPGMVSEADTTAQSETRYTAVEEKVSALPHNAAHVKTDVAVIRPFEDSRLPAKDFSLAGELVAQNLNSNAEHFLNTLVSVDRMKSLDVHGIVLVNSRSALLNGQYPHILLGETVPEDLSVYAEDLQADRIVVSDGRLAVGASFFKKYYGHGALNESLWFLGMPGNENEIDLTRALTDCGAETVVSIASPATDAACRDILYVYLIESLLLEGKTARESVSQTTSVVNDVTVSVVGNTNYLLNAKPVASDAREICIVMDSSDNMYTSAFADALTGTAIFTDTVLAEDCAVSIVSYGDEASIVSDFSDNKTLLFSRTEAIPASGGSDIGLGLEKAYLQLKNRNAKEKIAVLILSNMPTGGKTGDELISYANILKNQDIVLYTVSLATDENEADIHAYAEALASPGCHYRAENAADLATQLENAARQITGTRFINLKIEGPVFAEMTANDETLSSDPDNRNMYTDFGTLSVEGTEPANSTVVFRLNEKAAQHYILHLEGSDVGHITVTLSYADEKGVYTDTRTFQNIPVDYETRITLDAARRDVTALELDTDGDGDSDTVYQATAGAIAKEKSKMPLYLTMGGVCLFVLLVLLVVIIIAARRAKRRKAEAFKAPKLCPNCGAVVLTDTCLHCNTKIE